jgi:hypothetical protein
VQRLGHEHGHRGVVQRVPGEWEDMTYPPDGCSYEVTYRLGRRGTSTETFADELELGRWFKSMERIGAFHPEDFIEPDFNGENGYQIFCVTDAGKIGISYFHPRLVMGRIHGNSGRGPGSAQPAQPPRPPRPPQLP